MPVKTTKISNGFTLNMTNKVTLPHVDYINELAVDKNFSLGTSFKTPPKVLEDLYSLFRQEAKDPSTFELKNHLFSRAYLETDILFRPLTVSEDAYYKHTLLFYERIDFGNVLGITPMDKSLNVMMYLVHLSSKTNPKGSDDDLENDSQAGPVKVDDEEDIAAAMEDMSKSAPSNVPDPGNSDELSKDITKCVRDHLYDLTPSIANIYGKKKPSDVPINKKILDDIKIKAYLEDKLGLSTNVGIKKEKNNDSTERKKMQMDDHSQVNKVSKSDMMRVDFDDKFIKKDLLINQKVKPKAKKQILYMLNDDSGSMASLIKQTYVRAILLNRLQSVVEGKSELIFSLYESKRYETSTVTDVAGAQKLYRSMSLRRPNGGGTNIGHCLQETIDEIYNKPGFHDPEIMIVCDGDDRVYPDDLDYKGVKINVVLLGRENEGLKEVALKSGGKYTCEKMYN